MRKSLRDFTKHAHQVRRRWDYRRGRSKCSGKQWNSAGSSLMVDFPRKQYALFGILKGGALASDWLHSSPAEPAGFHLKCSPRVSVTLGWDPQGRRTCKPCRILGKTLGKVISQGIIGWIFTNGDMADAMSPMKGKQMDPNATTCRRALSSLGNSSTTA